MRTIQCAQRSIFLTKRERVTMIKKAIGSILMILGTSVGAAMLALPIVTSHEHLFMSITMLFFSWLIMTVGALCLLEVNLWLPSGTNLISMAGMTLGRFGKHITWFVYLLLLYSLICAYLSGMSDVVQGILSSIGILIPHWVAIILCLAVFGIIVTRGIATVDLVNRAFMSLKLIAYLVLIFFLSKYIHITQLVQGDYQMHGSVMMVMLTSFGYAIIIPSLRSYLNDDTRLLRRVVLIGSVLPLIMYILWVLVIQGVVPRLGDHGLMAILSSSEPNSKLMQSISALLHVQWLSTIVNLFVSICAVTSFLGVSICLTDCIADGLKVTKQGKSGLLVYTMSFLPPLIIVLVSPGIFIRALDYGGILCLILLIILPLAMFSVGRYYGTVRESHRKESLHEIHTGLE